MSEERLQEIKDSIEFQYTLAKAKGYDNALLFTNEEEELVEEIDRLNNMIERLNNQLQQKENIIKEVREYIENNDLYEQDYDYDYEENLVVGPPSDETARKILLEILDKENKQ